MFETMTKVETKAQLFFATGLPTNLIRAIPNSVSTK